MTPTYTEALTHLHDSLPARPEHDTEHQRDLRVVTGHTSPPGHVDVRSAGDPAPIYLPTTVGHDTNACPHCTPPEAK